MTARQYTRGLQKLFSRVYGSTLPNGDPLTPGITAGQTPLPDELYVDLLEDDICMALVNVDMDDDGLGGAYTKDMNQHEYLVDVVGVRSDNGTPNPAVWSGTEDGAYSHITKHSAPVGTKKLIYTGAVGAGTGVIPPDYLEVMFDCDDVTFVAVPDLAPKTEAIVLYKRVLVEGGDESNPLDINLAKSPLIAYFDGASVALDPNDNNVEVVISSSGLMRWGVGYDV
jgi:hypothetical protein